MDAAELANEVAYQNGAFIADSDEYIPRWEVDAAEYRSAQAAIGRARLNHPYGEGERQRLDLFHPSGKAEGLVVFVHGGYWLRFDRSYWSHFARGCTDAGWAVAIPSYTLAPEAQVAEMTLEIARAVEVAAALVSGRIRLTGHSAGGHLSARMGCADVPLSVRDRIEKIVPISPVADLRPLIETTMNEGLRLSLEEAAAESPTLMPAPDMPVTVWVGAEERPAFLDQARWLAEAWGASQRLAPGRHHFDVIDELEDADSPLVREILS